MECPIKGHRDMMHSEVLPPTAPNSAVGTAVILPKRATEEPASYQTTRRHRPDDRYLL
jgi:hypothetical protein